MYFDKHFELKLKFQAEIEISAKSLTFRGVRYLIFNSNSALILVIFKVKKYRKD